MVLYQKLAYFFTLNFLIQSEKAHFKFPEKLKITEIGLSELKLWWIL